MKGIGISTYNDHVLTKNLIESIKRLTPGFGTDYKIVVVDDGTKSQDIVNALKKTCNEHGIILELNGENRGIPYTWNRLVKLCNTDIMFIFNNDILVKDGTWLKRLEYFLTKNDKIGTVGFNTIFPGTPEGDWGEEPGHIGAAVGCCFGFKNDVWRSVVNPDGSIGFWEDLISFHEEMHFGLKLSEMGYYSFMMPWPSMVHVGGHTFRQNRELIERPVDWNRWKGLGYSKEEYTDAIIKSNLYHTEWKRNNIVWTNNKGIEVVDRMAFSRYMFAKYWNTLYAYDSPQIDAHKKAVDPLPERKIKWLDKDMVEIEDTVR